MWSRSSVGRLWFMQTASGMDSPDAGFSTPRSATGTESGTEFLVKDSKTKHNEGIDLNQTACSIELVTGPPGAEVPEAQKSGFTIIRDYTLNKR